MSIGFARALGAGALVACMGALVPAAAGTPIVWTGPTLTFTKQSTDPTLAVNQDRMVNDVWLTRGTNGGMFNIAPGQETSYDFAGHTSPADTRWATNLVPGNSAQTITATNWQQLNFTTWAAAYGGPGPALIGNITTRNAVVHLLTNDIYLDLQFTGFNSGGFFAYDRSTAPKPGDADLNGRIDADDYFLIDRGYSRREVGWENGDFNSDGTVNGDDYVIIDSAYQAQASVPVSAVPEPSAVWIMGLAAFARFARRRAAWSRRTWDSGRKRRPEKRPLLIDSSAGRGLRYEASPHPA